MIDTDNKTVLTAETENGADTDQETGNSEVQLQATGNGSPAADGVPSTPPKRKKKRTAKYYAAVFFIKLAVAALVVWFIFTFVAGIFICHTNSAYPSVRDGEFCLVNRLKELKQGSMIVYRHGGEVKFGRIIAFGGEKVEIFNDYITVDGYGISENVVYPTSPEGSAISYPYYVPEGCVFVMNDYRSDISDSRTYGGISTDDVVGTVVFTMRMRGI